MADNKNNLAKKTINNNEATDYRYRRNPRRNWGESRPGGMNPAVQGPGNSNWEAKNPGDNPYVTGYYNPTQSQSSGTLADKYTGDLAGAYDETKQNFSQNLWNRRRGDRGWGRRRSPWGRRDRWGGMRDRWGGMRGRWGGNWGRRPEPIKPQPTDQWTTNPVRPPEQPYAGRPMPEMPASDVNQYGDPIGTAYPGGTPLFDESTGKSISLEEYKKGRRQPTKGGFNDIPYQGGSIGTPGRPGVTPTLEDSYKKTQPIEKQPIDYRPITGPINPKNIGVTPTKYTGAGVSQEAKSNLPTSDKKNITMNVLNDSVYKYRKNPYDNSSYYNK